MDIVWFPLRVVVLAVTTVALAVAVGIFALAPWQTQSRRLAWVLAVDAIAIFLGEGLMFMVDSERAAYWMQVVSLAAVAAAPWMMFRFYATLDTPLMAVFRRPVVQKALLALSIAAPVAVLAFPGAYIVEVAAAQGVQLTMAATFAPAGDMTFALYGLVMLFGLAVAASYYRRAAAKHQAQAGAYLAAFTVRDGMFVLSLLALMAPSLGLWVTLTAVLGLGAFVPLLAYGILRNHLFDLDLKVKWTVRQGTLASMFAVAFFVVSEGVEQLLPIEGTLPGIAAAGLVALGIRPLQRWTARFADRVLPEVEQTPAYVDARKREVYAATLESVLSDGIMSEKDKRVLATLRERLGLDAHAAASIEAGMPTPA